VPTAARWRLGLPRRRRSDHDFLVQTRRSRRPSIHGDLLHARQFGRCPCGSQSTVRKRTEIALHESSQPAKLNGFTRVRAYDLVILARRAAAVLRPASSPPGKCLRPPGQSPRSPGTIIMRARSGAWLKQPGRANPFRTTSTVESAANQDHGMSNRFIIARSAKERPHGPHEAIDVAARHFVYKLFDATDRRPETWHTLRGIGEAAATVARAVERGWVLIRQDDSGKARERSGSLTDEGRRLARKGLPA
jgi:hypothetical protein